MWECWRKTPKIWPRLSRWGQHWLLSKCVVNCYCEILINYMIKDLYLPATHGWGSCMKGKSFLLNIKTAFWNGIGWLPSLAMDVLSHMTSSGGTAGCWRNTFPVWQRIRFLLKSYISVRNLFGLKICNDNNGKIPIVTNNVKPHWHWHE